MLNNLSIRKKLALVALGPLLLLLALSVLRIRGDLSDASDATDAQARATASAATGLLFDAVRVEAVENQNAVAISGLDLDEVRAETDAAIERWNGSVGEFSSIDGGALSNVVSDFNAHRAEVAAEFATQTGAQTVFAQDAEVLRTIAEFDGLLSQGADVEALDLRQAADVTTVSQSAAELQLLVMASAHGRVVEQGLPEALGAADAAAASYGLRNGIELPVAAGSYNTILQEFAGLAVGEDVGVSPNDWRAASDARATQLLGVREGEVRAASQAAADAQSDSQNAMRTAGLLALLGLIAALGLVFVVAKSIIASIAALRDEAANVAENDLPALVESLSTGRPYTPAVDEDRSLDDLADTEFGEVAAGLVSIRERAVGLGERVTSLQSGIADTYVNLARRNQSLVDRQLEAIDTLEAEERDSDRLALMYRVDHLATRMRRNAESLLVLADAKTPERHSPAVELREVLRVAIGEVEDYRRIIPIALDDLHVAGHRAQDLAHLLAELMENAAQHSPPGTAVDVSGAFEGSTGDYVVTILDHGTGLDDQQRAELNHLLRTPPASTLTISHSIGLHVVSRLADSLGISVTLDHGRDGGLVATTRIPAAVVAEWSHTAPAASAARPTPTSPVEPVVEPAPVAEVFTPPATPIPEAPATPEVAQPSPVAPEPDVVVPQASDGGVVPTIDMPELDLPSLGVEPDAPAVTPPTASEVFETATPDVFSVVEPDTEVAEPDPVAVPPAEVFTPVPQAVEPQPDPVAPEPVAPEPEVFTPVPQVFDEPVRQAEEVFSSVDTPPIATEPIPHTPAPTTPVPPPEPPAPPVVQAPPPQPVAEPAPAAQPSPQPVVPEPPAAMPAAAAQPVAETTAPSAPVTAAGLVKRQRQTSEAISPVDLNAERTAPSQRTPDQVKNMLSRYKTGLERGRGAAGTDGES